MFGNLFFLMKDIQAGKYKNLFWANIIGAHGDLDNDEAKLMNTNPATAAAWKGRVLLSITGADSKRPEKKKIVME